MSGFSDSKRAALRDFEARYDESARVSSLLPHGALASTSAQHARSSSEGSTHRQRSVAAPAHPAPSHPMAHSPYAHHGPFMPSPYGPPPMAPPFYPPGYGPVRFSATYILSRAYRPFVSCVCEFFLCCFSHHHTCGLVTVRCRGTHRCRVDVLGRHPVVVPVRATRNVSLLFETSMTIRRAVRLVTGL